MSYYLKKLYKLLSKHQNIQISRNFAQYIFTKIQFLDLAYMSHNIKLK